MSQIMYNYPAMMAHAGDMAGYAGTLQSLGPISPVSRPCCPVLGRVIPGSRIRAGRPSGTRP